MSRYITLLLFLGSLQLSFDSLAWGDDSKGISADDQRAGIRNAVKSIENQIRELSEAVGREVQLVATHQNDQQEAVVLLCDAMAGNVLLTRTYLALGIAELKMITLHSCVGCMSTMEKNNYLRHVEAIQFAIDERILEPQDLRVFRVLQAGVNQALRQEIIQLHSQNTLQTLRSDQPFSVANCQPISRRSGILRCFYKSR